MKKWKSIRDRYVRELKKIKERNSGEAVPVYVPTWPLFEELTFLNDSVRHRQ